MTSFNNSAHNTTYNKISLAKQIEHYSSKYLFNNTSEQEESNNKHNMQQKQHNQNYDKYLQRKQQQKQQCNKNTIIKNKIKKNKALTNTLYTRTIIHIASIKLEYRYIDFNKFKVNINNDIYFENNCVYTKISELYTIIIEGEPCIIADTHIIYGVDERLGEPIGIFDFETQIPTIFEYEYSDKEHNLQKQLLKLAIKKFHESEYFIHIAFNKIKKEYMEKQAQKVQPICHARPVYNRQLKNDAHIE
jgi:hypothetical protein